MGKEAKRYIPFFFDDSQIFAGLSEEEVGRLLLACLAYARGETDVALGGNERFLFPVFKMRIDRFMESYEERCRRNAENGRKGGRPRKNPKEAIAFFGNPEKPNKDQNQNEDQDQNEDQNQNEGQIIRHEPPERNYATIYETAVQRYLAGED